MTDIRHEIELVTPGLNLLEDHGEGAKSVIERTKKILHEAADRIEQLERELGEERYSREVASAKAWEFSDRIKELEFVLSFIANINYGNGPDVTMEHQSWAKRALGETK